jgi:DNA-binding transcriptional MerR regulator
MSAPAQPEARGKRLTIGTVCAALKGEHPDLSISKIRYLEDQGLLSPRRTRGGYRLYGEDDVERLRNILRLQRDAFLPLRVIREELEREPSAGDGRQTRPRRVVARTVTRIDLNELLAQSGATAELVRELEEYGLIAAGDGRYRGEDVPIVTAAMELARYGVGVRHLRAIHSAIQREAGLLEQLLAPALRARNPERRSAGLDDLDDLARLCSDLTEAVILRDLRRIAESAAG